MGRCKLVQKQSEFLMPVSFIFGTLATGKKRRTSRKKSKLPMQKGSPSTKRRRSSASPAKSRASAALSSVSAAAFLQESVGSQGDDLQIAGGGIFVGGRTGLELNSLLHNFGVQRPEHKQSIMDVLEFMDKLGSDGLRASFRAILGCMVSAVNAERNATEQMDKMEAEIKRLYAMWESSEMEKRRAEVSMDEQLASFGQGNGMELSFFQGEEDDAGESLGAKVARLEEENLRLNNLLIERDDDVGSKVDDARAEYEEKTARLEKECEDTTAKVKAMEAEMALLRGKVSDMEVSNAGLRKQVSGVAALQQPGGIFFDEAAQTAVSCPILLATGAVISMWKLIDMWAQAPGRGDGEVHRAVLCNGVVTQVADQEQVELVLDVATTLGISSEIPMWCEYTKPPQGGWTKFAPYDQVALASRICKLYRQRTVGPKDFVVVGGGEMKVVFALEDEKLAFHVQSLVGEANSIMQGRIMMSPGWNPFGVF
jgi:hypothetical protein